MPDGILSILVVDDDMTSREITAAQLEASGFHCTTAENGAEALEKVRESPPDLVFLDLIMPVMSGKEVLEVLVVEAPEMPVIVVSGTVDEGLVGEVLKLGAWDFLVKPVSDLELLRGAVEKALEQQRLRAESRRDPERHGG